MRRFLFLMSVLAGCTTTVVGQRKPPPPAIFKGQDNGCSVNDYPSATDLPDGSENLGWVQVPKEEDDEATYIKLREAICAKGGDALSQLNWINETTKDGPFIYGLRANAWRLPEGKH